MFFVTYLRRELSQRKRQAIVIAVGLALGVGLVITVTAVSSGVNTAQAKVVHSLYGVGTDLTVTRNPAPPNPAHPPPGVCAGSFGGSSSAAPSCSGNLGYPPLGTMTTGAVAKVAKLPAVSGAAGGFTLTYGGTVSDPAGTAVNGIDVGHLGLGPLSAGTITAGKGLSSSDAHSNVTVVDSDYATSKGLHVGSTVSIAGRGFTVVGIVKQSQASSPPQVYIPLARVQALYGSVNHVAADLINTIYVSTPSSANVASVQSEINKALPSVTVSSQANLANEVTGSLRTTAHLAHELGTWLAVLVLLAAFALAILLTLSAVGRRVREFGTLKALGWRSRRIIEQVLGECLVMGVFGAALGIGLGYGAAEVITAIAPGLSEFVPAPTPFGSGGGAVPIGGGPAPGSRVPVHLTAPVPADVIIVAVVIAIAGGILAGLFASWRIARLRPADALARAD